MLFARAAELQTAQWVTAVVSLCVFLLVTIGVLRFLGVIFSAWLRATLSAAPISIMYIIGMRLRRTDVNAVLKPLIMARQAGVAISCGQMESAYLQGVDLEKLTLAMIHAKKEGVEVTFEELVESDLEDRLAEKLKRPVVSASGMGIARADGRRAAEPDASSMRICRKCSKQVSGDSKICRNCGAIL